MGRPRGRLLLLNRTPSDPRQGFGVQARRSRLEAYPATLRTVWLGRGEERAALYINHSQRAKFSLTLIREHGGSQLAFRAPHEAFPQPRSPFPDYVGGNRPTYGDAHERFLYDGSHWTHSHARVRPHQPRGSLIKYEGMPSCGEKQGTVAW